MLTDHVLKGALAIFMPALEVALLPKARANELVWQRQVHEKVSGIGVPLDNPQQFTAEDGTFKPNNEMAKSHAQSKIRYGIGTRLQSAIVLYRVDEQMECLRHIIIALDALFCIIEWKEASRWCNEQNTLLHEKHRKKAA